MKPYYQDNYITIHHGDCRAVMREMEPESINCCVTSPPYFGLRDYGHPGQLGLESTPEEYTAAMVDVFREVRRVLRKDGTLWLNLGDSYSCQGGQHAGRGDNQKGVGANNRQWREGAARADGELKEDGKSRRNRNGTAAPGVKPKDLIGIPWRVAFALQADGWYLRQDIIWHKPNPMPESVTDRCTKAHEYIFLLAKSERYYCDMEAIKEKAVGDAPGNVNHKGKTAYENGDEKMRTKVGLTKIGQSEIRNRRSVWTVPTQPCAGAHFATFPPDLILPAIKAGCPKDGTVLDPFGGSGTTGMVASGLGRKAVMIELNEGYIKLELDRAAMPLYAPAEQGGLFSVAAPEVAR